MDGCGYEGNFERGCTEAGIGGGSLEGGDYAGGMRRRRFVMAKGYVPGLRWRYVVKGLWRRGETATLVGPSNGGKTAVLGLAASKIVTGQRFLGLRTTQGIVVHVAAEGPKSVLERSRAYAEDVDREDASQLVVWTEAVNLFVEQEVRAFVREARAEAEALGDEIVLVVFDTLARSMEGASEVDPAHMTQIDRHARLIAHALDAHVAIVHHTGKDEGRGARGSSALLGAVDTELLLVPHKDGDGVAVVTNKQRTMSRLAPLHFRVEPFLLGLDEDGEARTCARAVALESGWGAAGSTATARAERSAAVQAALDSLERDHGARAKASGAEAAEIAFATRDLLDRLPPAALEGVTGADNQATVLRRTLQAIAEAPGARLRKAETGTGWILLRRAGGAA